MGLGNSTRATYVSIVDGKIARRYKVGIPGITKERTNSEGRIVHEQFFDHVSGYITDIQKVANKNPKYGDQLVVSMIDGEERFILSMHIDGGYGRAFLKILPNIDFTKRTTVIPQMKVVDGQKKITIFITQQGISGALKHFFTANESKGMPTATSREWKGKTEWDYTKQIEFLLMFFEKNIRANMMQASGILPDKPQNVPADATVKNSALSISDAEFEDDDLPF